jgi:hypothetical protein
MTSRSRLLRCGARGLLVGGVVAVGLTLDLGGRLPLHAQDPAQGASQKDIPMAAPTPEARLRAQRLRTRLAKAAFEIARLNSELAEIGVEAYREETYTPDLAALEGEFKVAGSDLARAEDRLDWARRMFDKKYVSQAQLVTEELNFKKAQFALEKIRSKKEVFAKYTGPRMEKALQVDVVRARNEELDKKAAWKHEEAREADLEREAGRK